MPRKTSTSKFRSRRSDELDVTPNRTEPFIRQICDILRDRIVAGRYLETGELPPELSLMAEFNVSRHTIRGALQKLVVDGLIERYPGRGTIIVKRDPHEANWAIRSLDDLIGEFGSRKATLVSTGLVAARQNPEIAKLFGIRASASLFQLTRVLSSDNGAYAVSSIFTTQSLSSVVPTDRLGVKSFVVLIEEASGIRAARARQFASACLATGRVTQLLDIPEGDPLLILRRTFLSRSNMPIVHAELYCRPDRYTQFVEFVRDDEGT